LFERARIIEFVREAPHGKWLSENASFDDFYNACRDYAQRVNRAGFPNIKQQNTA